MICKPEAVVMGFPAVWADAVLMAAGVATAAATAAKAVRKIVRREKRILAYLVRETAVSSPRRAVSIALFLPSGHVAVAIDGEIAQQW
jgi:hypothetical protein